MTNYSDRIKELRKMRHWTQQDLADKLDITKVAVSQYERGVRKPDINVVTALCDIFNVSSDYLLGNDDVTVRYLDEKDIRKLDGVRTSGQPTDYYINTETAEEAQRLLDDPDYKILFDAARDSRPEDLRMAADLLLRLKRTNPDG